MTETQQQETPQAETAPQETPPQETGRIVPSVGRIVHYRLNKWDAEAINRRNAGNPYREGDIAPMIIVRTWGTTESTAVNGRLILDGHGLEWVTSRQQGDQPGQWSAPPRV